MGINLRDYVKNIDGLFTIEELEEAFNEYGYTIIKDDQLDKDVSMFSIKNKLCKLSKKEYNALFEAVSVLYLNDRSDYINGLWGVVKAILGDDVVNDDKFNLNELMSLLRKNDF